MAKQTKQTFLKGAIILAVGAMLVKIIGVVFKIPLINLIGSSGLGYFNTAYDLYLLIYTLAVAGLPVAVAKMIAESVAQKRYKDVTRIYKASLRAFLLTGTIGFILMVGGSFIFVKFIRNSGAIYSLLALSPMVFFSCMIAAQRGYYEGLRNMYPTAVSQIIEALAKLLLGLFLAYAVVIYGQDYYLQHGKVFFITPLDAADAERIINALGAAAAILGVTIGSILATVYLLIYHKGKGKPFTDEEIEASPPARSYSAVIKSLVKIAIPVCLGALVLNLTAFVDLSFLQRRIGDIVVKIPDFAEKYYPGTSLSAAPGSELANTLYGYYGYALILYAIVPTITQAFGVSALPTVTTAWTKGDRSRLKDGIESALKITALIAFPAGLGLTVMSEPILTLIYGSDPLGVQIAAPLLSVLGISVIFLSFSSPVNSMLQAIGKQKIPVILLVSGGIIKIVTNYVLVGIPSININGAPIGTLCCCAFVTVCGLIALCIKAKIVPSLLNVFVKPLISAAFCVLSAYLSHSLLSQVITKRAATVVSLAISVVIYVILLVCLKVITVSELKNRLNRKKIA